MATNAEVIRLLKEHNNLAAAFTVRNNLDHALNEIMKTFFEDLKREIEHCCPGVTCTTDHTNNDTWFMDKPRILFKHPDWKNVFFAMEFEHSGLRDFTIGFLKKSEVKDIRQLKEVKERVLYGMFFETKKDAEDNFVTNGKVYRGEDKNADTVGVFETTDTDKCLEYLNKYLDPIKNASDLV